MDTYCLLFRGINVGGRNRLPMQALKTLLEEAGYAAVKTYIQSGNVVLRAPQKPSPDLAAMIEAQFGFRPDVLVLDKPELDRAIAHNPFTGYEGKTVHFYFCAATPAIDADRLDALVAADEDVALQDEVFYLHAPGGIGRSKLVANIESCLGVRATGRNLNTVLKLRDMANQA